MSRASQTTSSYLAAIVLAAVTLGVFFALRYYGPESAVRRFHRASLLDDRAELQRVTRQPIDSQNVQILRAQVREAARMRAYIQMRSVDRQPSRVVVEAVYLVPRGGNTIFWVVRKRDGLWQVDAIDTLRLIEQLMRGWR